MTYSHLTCYYHSGTGNSYKAARWLAGAATENGISASLIPVNHKMPKDELRADPRQLVGIYHPTHGLMPSWSMIKFLFRLPRGRGSRALIVATRGAYPLGSLIVPGGAGMALFFPWLILLLKGYRVLGGMGIDMPANVLNVHWGFKPKNVDHVIAWGKRRHTRLAGRVLAGKIYFHPLNLIWELMWCAPFVLWPVFPLIYLLIGRVFMAKLMFSDSSCVGCGRCARNCPSQAIRMIGARQKTPFWTHHCEVCMRCMGYCKFMAVQASHLWMVPVIFGTSFLTASFVQESLTALFGLHSLRFDLAFELTAILLTFISLPVFYYAFWGLQRFRPIRSLFTYTTLTKYYPRRYHAPLVALKDMKQRADFNPPDDS